MKQPNLFDREPEPESAPLPPDHGARLFAIDPANHVVLEASAGTGKTRVLVDRYVRLLRVGVDPRNILAMTFTRKAAAEMRTRVLEALEREVTDGAVDRDWFRSIQARLGDFQITTIDGFCFSLLREFPLEAGVDPDFEVADETEMARFASEALDRTARIARRLAGHDESVRLLLARVKAPILREALATLIDRRHVALAAVRGFVGRRPVPASALEASARFIDRIRDALGAASKVDLLDGGPIEATAFRKLAEDLGGLDAWTEPDPARARMLRRRLEAYALTKDRQPRKKLSAPYSKLFPTSAARQRHEAALAAFSPLVAAALEALDRDLDVLLARGVLRLFEIAVSIYGSMLEEEGLLDFAGMLERSVALLERQEEFARSRLKLQSRFHHLLIDEFQDTSRLQWRLIDLLIGAWAEGEGASDGATSVFLVGDRKQSIYRFRHAEVALLEEAAGRIMSLGGERPVRHAIVTSFRASAELLAFVNALSAEMTSDGTGPDAWQYTDRDRFPIAADPGAAGAVGPALGLVVESKMEDAAAVVADEIVRLLDGAVVRDRDGVPRPARPDDIAILFRARAGHQYFEDALDARGVRTYVYKGLGFFDAPEVQDLEALIRFLAAPESDLAAAAFLRSRFVRLSDQALVELAPAFSAAVLGPTPPEGVGRLGEVDRRLFDEVQGAAPRWVAATRALPPGALVDAIIRESAYQAELAGSRLEQARENVKKVRTLVRRIESRGYATFDRMASYFATLRAGDESNAVIEAVGAVSLMTIHAAKGLEFPIVFVVNLQASGRGRPPGFSVIESGPDGEPEVTFGTTAATALEERRDIDELRRLLYVAMTRARDRLYLSATVAPDGKFSRPRRSLASLLPASLASAFSIAASGTDQDVLWRSASGTFAIRVCRKAAEPIRWAAGRAADEPAPPLGPGALTFDTVVVRRASDMVESVGVAEPAIPVGPTGDRFVGTMVHRLFERRADPEAPDSVLGRLVTELAGAEPPAGGADRVEQVVLVFRALAQQTALRHLLASGECHYEVPFSLAISPERGVIRGTVDCLVVDPEGRATVVELKTGRPHPAHQAQADLYGAAMERLLGVGPVEARVFYPAE